MAIRSDHDLGDIVRIRELTGDDLDPRDLDDPNLLLILDEDIPDMLMRVNYDPLHGVWFVPAFEGGVRHWRSMGIECARALIRRGHGESPVLWKNRHLPAVSVWLRRRGVQIVHRTFADSLGRDGDRLQYVSITANELLRALGV